jgi:hypothetical protein
MSAVDWSRRRCCGRWGCRRVRIFRFRLCGTEPAAIGWRFWPLLFASFGIIHVQTLFFLHGFSARPLHSDAGLSTVVASLGGTASRGGRGGSLSGRYRRIGGRLLGDGNGTACKEQKRTD